MKILVVGLNHKSASIDIREKLAFDATGIIEALTLLKSTFYDSEFVLLSTCNRVEIYCACSNTGNIGIDTLTDFLSKFQEVPLEVFKDYLYVYKDIEAVNHLLTVASSFDSMVVGEAEILGQVKDSYKLACTAKSTGKVLNKLFHCAFATAKKVHTNTSISNGRVSVAGVAVELAMQLFSNISSAKVVVIGAGEMGELLVRHLLHVGCKSICVINRSYDRGLEMANKYGIEAKKWEELVQQFIDVEIVISSAASQDYLFDKKTLGEIMRRRRKGALLIIDVAVPRNFDPLINKIEDIYLYSIDELSDVAERNRQAREHDIVKGTEIINESVVGFMDWFKSRDIGPLIGEMKCKFAQISQIEMERFFVGVREEACCREVMEAMMHRVVNRLLHCVIKNIDIVAKEQGPAEAMKLVDRIVQQAKETLNQGNKE